MLFWMIFVSTYVVGVNIGYAALQVWLLQRRPDHPKWLGVAVCLWAFFMSSFFLAEVFGPPAWKLFLRDHLYFPMAVQMVWNILMLQVLMPALIVVALIVGRMSTRPLSQPLDPAGISRRRFLYLVGYGAAPILATGMGLHGTLTRHELRVRSFDIPVVNLPPELEGLTIAHVSDLHSGLFVGPERLRIMSDATNDLKADLIMVTGDLINRTMDEFPDALESLRRLESPHGMFLCEGNHDVIPGNGLVVEACRRNGLAMLWNQTAAVSVRGRRILIGAVPWMKPDAGTPPQMVTDLYPPRADGDVRILLAHHPHFFDVSDRVDLLLSGHTHGGQIMFGDVGLGNLRFKYNSGRYHRNNMTMIVNNGCGDWFPCRIGAPAEVGLLRLTKAV